jgi:PAS domain S-box-containing protein
MSTFGLGAPNNIDSAAVPSKSDTPNTEREKGDRRALAHLVVTQLLAHSSSLREITDRVLETMCGVSGCEIAVLWQVDEQHQELYCVRRWSKPHLSDTEFAKATDSLRLRRGQGIPGRIWETNQPAWISDLRLDDNFPRQASAARDGLHSAFAFPVPVKDRVVGVIEFFSSQVREPDHEFMNMMAGIGIQMGQVASRNQQEDARTKLAAIVESSDDAIVSKDLNGIVTSWNAAAERIFGYTADEIVDRPITVLIPPELQSDELMILAKIRAGERIEHFQTVRLHKDGTPVDVSLTISPVKDDDGNIVGAAKIARDITHQKKSEQAALRLAAIVESSDDAIVSKDLNGIIKSWNKGAERIFGYREEEIVGQPITTIIPPELRHEEVEIIEKIKSGQRIDHFETERVAKNGNRVQLSLTISPVKDPDGKIIGAAKIARDVTQQKKLEAALHTSERLASVGRLAATVAHEINNPLEAVTNYIYLAKQQPGIPGKLKRYLESADRELARVSHIAQQTLGFYRDNSQPVSLVVAEIVEDVLAIYERKVQYKSLRVQRDIEPNLVVCTLQGELKQILSNLISNAIDACSEDGKIIIRARPSGDYRTGRPGIRISVADNGVGISAENWPRVFTPFFSTKREVGTGLGLWITKDLLEKRGGYIRFRSSQSSHSGTVMNIYLPMMVSTTQSGAAA